MKKDNYKKRRAFDQIKFFLFCSFIKINQQKKRGNLFTNDKKTLVMF